MTQKEFVAYAILASLALALITAIMEPVNEDNWFALSGLGLFAFGPWASYLLLKK